MINYLHHQLLLSGLAPQVGDGTTTIVLLSTEILKLCKPFVEEGLHPQTIVKGLRKASKIVSPYSISIFMVTITHWYQYINFNHITV